MYTLHCTMNKAARKVKVYIYSLCAAWPTCICSFALISLIILIVCHQYLNIQISKYKIQIQIFTCCPPLSSTEVGMMMVLLVMMITMLVVVMIMMMLLEITLKIAYLGIAYW